jgi:hypothetical protein
LLDGTYCSLAQANILVAFGAHACLRSQELLSMRHFRQSTTADIASQTKKRQACPQTLKEASVP